MVDIDLSRAFDTVDHDLLLQDIAELPINHHLKRFLFAYLRGRQTYVEFRGVKSKFRKMRQGVPQGGVLSPLLFNIYMSKLPTPTGKMKLITYADDSNVLNSGKKLEPICAELNTYLATLTSWFKTRNLSLSAPKSSATVFTTFGNEMSRVLPIEIDGTVVPTVKTPKILGVTYDNLMTFSHHAKQLKDRVAKRTNVLKSLAGTSWGKDKEVLLTTHKAISGSIINYCAPIWTPPLSETSWSGLQAEQNAALRVTTGCVKMSQVSHLHNETKMMPVREHCDMLSKQFLLATRKPDHPNHQSTQLTPPPRLMKENLQSRFLNDISPLTDEDRCVDEASYKAGLKLIHTDCVGKTIENLEDNKVLHAPAPEIHPSETLLPRKTRTTLAQLRSGYSTVLNSFLNRINPALYPTDSCPKCGQSPHTTAHLFNCPADPTDTTIQDLWDDPLAAASFLGLPTTEEPTLDNND